MTTRRLVLTRSAALVGAASTGLLLPQIARAQGNKVRVGLMLPYTGTYAQLGVAIENGVRMAIEEKGGKLGGRDIEWFKVDDESEPAKGVENASKLVQRDKVDVLIGTVHSGVQMGIQKVVRDSGTLCIIPNAGVHAATRALCAPNVFRTSFTNSQPTLALGKPMYDKGIRKAVSRTSTRPATRRSRASATASPRRAARWSRNWACPSRRWSSRRCSPRSPRSSRMPWPASSPAAPPPSSSATTPPPA
jgi:branched-chain amino acid transport system substrate-binding protein